MTGVIKRLNERRFGFILGEDNREYFFHQSVLKNARWDEVGVGQEVTFEVGEGEKGPRAEDVYV